MKFLVVLASLLLAVSATSDSALWAKFKAEHGKIYRNVLEEQQRFVIFQKNLRTIEAHNEKFNKGEESYTLGINQFADLTSEEFRARLKYNKPNLGKLPIYQPPANYTAPDSIDWRDHGAVLAVKNQGDCGSCWAFSTTGGLEGQNAIKHSKKIQLSEQELVDCSSNYGNAGCDGGDMGQAYKYVKAKGISTESAYPYKAVDGTCHSSAARADISISGFTQVGSNENALKTAVGSVGPISIGMNADLLQLYSSGIFDHSACTHDLNHGVLAVGYGHEGKDYWIVKNSWGSSWGEKGYFRIKRGSDQCGLALDSTYPNIH